MMVTLLGEIKFWSFCDNIVIKDADLGCVRYQEKQNVHKGHRNFEDKQCYIESRDGTIIIKNNRPNRLRDALKDFQDILMKERVVWSKWLSPNILMYIFATGLIVYILVNSLSGDIVKLTFEKYLIGKLLSEYVSDAVVTKTSILLAYNESRITVIHSTKGLLSHDAPQKLGVLEAKVASCDIVGPSGRRFERKLTANLAGDIVVVWWTTSENEVYPWSPLASDRDRANLLVYSLHGTTMELLCYCRTEMSPLSIMFSQLKENLLLTVEQGFSKKGDVIVLSCVYEIDHSALHRHSVTTVPLEAPLSAYQYTPGEDCLLLACNNGVLALHSGSKGMTHVGKAGLIPTSISWLDTGMLVAVGNDRGHFQIFDLALSLVRLDTKLDDAAAPKVFDACEYFKVQSTLSKLFWAPTFKVDATSGFAPYLLLLHFAKGPLACIVIDTGGPVSFGSSVTALLAQYLKHLQIDEALNLLMSLSWDQDGPLAMHCLSSICAHLLKGPLTAQKEAQMEAALGTFHVPVQPLSPALEEEFGPTVRAITRRFFFQVLRHGNLEKAYRLAIDLRDYDCFMSVERVARKCGDMEVATVALESADEIAKECHSCSSSCGSGSCNGLSRSNSGCSRSCSETCSTCFDSASSHAEDGDVLDSTVSSANIYEGPDEGSHPQVVSRGAEKTATTSTAPDGTITINIREPSFLSNAVPEKVPPSKGPPFESKPRVPSKQGVVPPKPPRKTACATQTVREMINAMKGDLGVEVKSVGLQLNKEDLRRQYGRTLAQETTTEEEDGTTVKVVHFGIV